MIRRIIIRFILIFQFDRISEFLKQINILVYLLRIEKKHNLKINFVNQGGGGITIAGDVSKFDIDSTSHLKSDTFIECSGGVRIGRYFHPGRGLTIFSVNHNYISPTKIPYDEIIIKKPVAIEDFVWVGANVTICPGVTIGEGCVVASGSVVVKNAPPFAIIGGNPAQVIKYRNIEEFLKLKNDKAYY